jgi:hypothetical protein
MEEKMAVIIFMLIGALTIGTTGCGCENTVYDALVSPDGQRKAVLFSRNCGATTGPNLQVSVVSRERSARGGGNTATMDVGHDSTLWHANLPSLVKVTWVSPSRLMIAYDRRLRVFSKQASVANVDVEYKAVEH